MAFVLNHSILIMIRYFQPRSPLLSLQCIVWTRLIQLFSDFFLLQALHLLEFLELNTVLGASHFTFYNHTLGPRANCVLKHYVNGDFLPSDTSSKNEYRRPIANQRATVNVLPWDLRMRSQKDIRTEGLFAALNDCVYRNMYR